MKKLFKKPRVPAQLANGSKVTVNLESIPIENWKTYHGTTAKGDKVQSLHGCEVGRTTILATDNGVAFSAPTDELEVFAVQFLEDKGYAITANKAGRSAS
ncbi:MAG: hypothetical protein NUV49_00360 [Patescibacteria group bacterium]|nr:hypothetical protein [Patescibacteria group bacterium]